MPRFIVLYHAPLAVAERYAQATPQEAQAGLAAWQSWATRLGSALLDPGSPLGNAQNMVRTGTSPSSSDVIGMSILRADSMTEALALVDGHHHLKWADGCEITVLEEMAIPELE